jgi:hypothetical protein
MDPALFVLDRGQDPEDFARARHICADCPVAVECLVSALLSPPVSFEHPPTVVLGLWGGYSQGERKRLRALLAEDSRYAYLRDQLGGGTTEHPSVVVDNGEGALSA